MTSTVFDPQIRSQRTVVNYGVNMGRPKGVKNIRSFNAEILAERLGCDPLEILLRFAKGDWEGLGYDSEVYHLETEKGPVKECFVITPNMRLTAAKEAVKYLHAAKHSAEITTGDEGFRIIVEDYSKKNE